MSIDLCIRISSPIGVGPLLPNIGAILAEILGLTVQPQLVLHDMEDGRWTALASDLLEEESNRSFYVSEVNAPESVSVGVPGRYIFVTFSSASSYFGKALAAAIAIALSKEMGTPIEDDSRYFVDALEYPPEKLMQTLKVTGTYSDYHQAADELEDRIASNLRERNGCGADFP